MIRNKFKIIITCLFILLFLGCGEGEVFDCLFSPYLTIGDDEPPEGIVGANYNFSIIANIENDPNDDSYDYWFYITGSLPTGLKSTVDGRYLDIYGTPQAAGEYEFLVYVATPESENFYGWDSCVQASDWEDEKSFVIKINDDGNT